MPLMSPEYLQSKKRREELQRVQQEIQATLARSKITETEISNLDNILDDMKNITRTVSRFIVFSEKLHAKKISAIAEAVEILKREELTEDEKGKELEKAGIFNKLRVVARAELRMWGILTTRTSYNFFGKIRFEREGIPRLDQALNMSTSIITRLKFQKKDTQKKYIKSFNVIRDVVEIVEENLDEIIAGIEKQLQILE